MLNQRETPSRIANENPELLKEIETQESIIQAYQRDNERLAAEMRAMREMVKTE